MAPGTFTSFRNFPQEIQDIIWDFAIRDAETRERFIPIIVDLLYLAPTKGSLYILMYDVWRQSWFHYPFHDTGSDDSLQGRFWRVCRASRNAVQRRWQIFERKYATFVEVARTCAVLRRHRCIWIPQQNLAECSRWAGDLFPTQPVRYDPAASHEENVRAVEAALTDPGPLVRWDLSYLWEIRSTLVPTPFFFHSEAHNRGRQDAYGLSRPVQLGEVDRVF